MTIEQLREELRRLVAERPRNDEQPYDMEIRRAAVAYALACRKEGQTWTRLATGVPLSVTTLSKWVAASEEKAASATKLVPVEVVEAKVPTRVQASVGNAESYPVLLSPGGYRLVGLTVEQAIAAFRVLG